MGTFTDISDAVKKKIDDALESIRKRFSLTPEQQDSLAKRGESMIAGRGSQSVQEHGQGKEVDLPGGAFDEPGGKVTKGTPGVINKAEDVVRWMIKTAKKIKKKVTPPQYPYGMN